MATWVLVLWIHAGVMSSSDSMALTEISGFKSEANCLSAGKAATKITSGTVKTAEFVCLKQE